MFRTFAIAALSVLTIASFSTNADARNGKGFLADIGVATGLIDESTADRLDGVHHNLGAPLNQLNPLSGGGDFRAATPQVPVPPQMPMSPMGNRCMTPVGVFGPGPFQPVG